MRTTLDIDDEVLQAAKELARREGRTAGQVVSDLVRRALTQPPPEAGQGVREPEGCYGFRPFASRGGLVSNEAIDELRDQDGI
ncbi:MAG: ribbon-helix-helix domain-containing protein [Xanthomonadaceae bacterium]|nr:ribbon-helix-helix domain-containing protein [Xanthomonadaceae bacterium]